MTTTKTSTNQNSSDIELPRFIDQPDLQSAGQRTVLSILALLAWICWLYLFLPLLTLVGWAISYQRVNQYIVHNKDGFFQQIELLGPIVIIMGTLLIFWATYNWVRFRGSSRRVAPQDATVNEIAVHFKISANLVHQAQSRQVNVFYFDENGAVIDIAGPESGAVQEESFVGLLANN